MNRYSPLDLFMKIGLVHFMAFPETMKGQGPILETLTRVAEDDFFRAVEVTAINDDKVRREAGRLLSTAGLEVGFGAQPSIFTRGLDLNSPDETERRAALEACEALVGQAREIGAVKFAVTSGPDPGSSGRASALERLSGSLAELGKRCREEGLALVLEVFDREVDKKRLIGSTADAVMVAREVRRLVPEFGLMIDLSHLPLMGEGPEESLGAAAGCLTHVHIGNCVIKHQDHPLYGDWHPRFGCPEGECGVLELRRFLRALFEIGYLTPGGDRTVAFEVRPAAGETPGAVITQAKRTLKEAWAGLEPPGINSVISQ